MSIIFYSRPQFYTMHPSIWYCSSKYCLIFPQHDLIRYLALASIWVCFNGHIFIWLMEVLPFQFQFWGHPFCWKTSWQRPYLAYKTSYQSIKDWQILFTWSVLGCRPLLNFLLTLLVQNYTWNSRSKKIRYIWNTYWYENDMTQFADLQTRY